MFGLETSSYFRDLDWEKLKAFYYVAKVGNISHAAPFLDLNQSSFSRSIASLERHLGYPLFVRRKNGVTLTRKGHELFNIVENIFFDVKKFTQHPGAISSYRSSRKIRIAASHEMAAYLINDLILEYNKYHPDLLFEIIEMKQAIDVILYDMDLAIQPHKSTLSKTTWQVIQEPFIVLEKKLYASAEYLKIYGEPKTVNDLKNHLFLIHSKSEALVSVAQGSSKLVKQDKSTVNPVLLSNSLECLMEAAKQGKGIMSAYDKMTVVQRANLQNILPSLIIQKCEEYFTYPEYLKDDQDIINIKEYLRGQVCKVK